MPPHCAAPVVDSSLYTDKHSHACRLALQVSACPNQRIVGSLYSCTWWQQKRELLQLAAAGALQEARRCIPSRGVQLHVSTTTMSAACLSVSHEELVVVLGRQQGGGGEGEAPYAADQQGVLVGQLKLHASWRGNTERIIGWSSVERRRLAVRAGRAGGRSGGRWQLVE